MSKFKGFKCSCIHRSPGAKDGSTNRENSCDKIRADDKYREDSEDEDKDR